MGTKPPKGTLHWASTEFVEAEARVYDKLFSVEIPGTAENGAEGEEVDWLSQLNPDSLVVHSEGARGAVDWTWSETAEKRFQLQRLGYFTIDKDSTTEKPVLNRIVTLKESKELKALQKK